jgi:hypothetical protein
MEELVHIISITPDAGEAFLLHLPLLPGEEDLDADGQLHIEEEVQEHYPGCIAKYLAFAKKATWIRR